MNLQFFKRAGIMASTVMTLAAYGQITPESLRVEHLSENILINTPKSADENPRFSGMRNLMRCVPWVLMYVQ